VTVEQSFAWAVCRIGVTAITLIAAAAPPAVTASPGDELRAVEEAFAATMADRDLAAFTAFLDPEVVFFNGDTELRGSRRVAEAWAAYFEGDEAPFSWRPEVVTVLDSGGLGLTSGPIFDPEGRRIGTFNSVWRRDEAGTWRIVFDRGCE
jgi:ketosteroid isomerase-like protein